MRIFQFALTFFRTKKSKNCCRFRISKYTKNIFFVTGAHEPARGAYIAPLDPLSGFGGPLRGR